MLIGICDDERCYHEAIQLAASQWKREKHPDLVLSIQSYETAEALSADREFGIQFDILFLDIRLPHDSGLALAKEIRETDPYVPIVFITNHRQYSVDGYEVTPFRYLLKPLREESIQLCLDHAFSLLSAPEQPELVVVQDGVHIRLYPSRIVSISCGRHKAIITTADHPKPYFVYIRGSFDEFLKKVPSPFFIRCHNSHMINAMYIESASRTEVHMKNGECFPVSRPYAPKVLEHIRKQANGGLG